MIKSELLSVFYNKRKLLLILLFIFIVCFDAYLAYKSSFLYEYNMNPVYELGLVLENTPNASSAGFLSAISKGHIPQYIIVWLLPLYFLFIHSDLHLRELRYDNYQLLEIRASKTKIYINKLLTSFLIGFSVAMIAVVLNYIICMFIFDNGLRQTASAPGIFSFLSAENPQSAYIVYMFIFSFISGFLSAAMTALCYLVQYRIPLYAISFGVWYFMMSGRNSIAFLMQPFIEYGLDYLIPMFFIFIGTVTLTMVLGYIKVKMQ